MVSLIINIEKKHIYFFVVVSLFLFIIGIVYAFGSKNPTVHGHSLDEIDMKWIPRNPQILATLPGTVSGTPYSFYYGNAIPSDAKAIWFHVTIYKGNNPNRDYTPSGSPVEYLFYVQDSDGTRYYYPVYIVDYGNDDSFDTVSDSFWMPVTPDKKLYLALSGTLSDTYNGFIRVIGHRM